MARVPLLHRRRRSRRQRALDLAKGTAMVWTTVKASSAGARAATKGRSAAKGVRRAGRPMVKILALPVAAMGVAVIWRKTHDSGDATTESARPLGPVASAETVSPPAASTATGSPAT